MRVNTSILIIVSLFLFILGMGEAISNRVCKKISKFLVPVNLERERSKEIIKEEIVFPIKNDISEPRPSYMNYDQTLKQIAKWNSEAPELTELGVYGQSSKGKDCYYLRIFNKRLKKDKPRVMITACIHGNEPLASSTVMWYMGALLEKYGKDEFVTRLIDSRDIYFVPIVSPDSYPSSREVDGVDPNRDFPSLLTPNHISVAPVKAIQNLFNKTQPNAVMSCHTWGRVYLTPYGGSMKNCPDHAAIMSVTNKMKSLSGYRCIRACDMYGTNGNLNNIPIRTVGYNEGFYGAPIYGTEVDWYYRGGSFYKNPNVKIHRGSFAIVCEFGTHQRIPTQEDTKVEFQKTFAAFLVFIQEAPLVEIWWNDKGEPINSDGSPKKN